MNCQQFKRLISDFLDGDVPEQVRAEFNQHREICRTCAKEFSRERRIRLYLKYFPTVKSVNDDFRKELIELISKGELKPAFSVNLPYVLVTFVAILITLIGVLFAVKAYRSYIFREQIFIAIFEDDAHFSQPSLPASGGTRYAYPVNAHEPLILLNLQELTPESFVLRLLAKYHSGELSETLVSSLLVETGILDGVRMRSTNGSVLDPLTGKPDRIEVIFPKRLSASVVAGVKGSDIPSLRSFVLDLINTFGIYVPVLVPEEKAELLKNGALRDDSQVIDLTRVDPSELELLKNKTYSVLFRFRSPDQANTEGKLTNYR